MGAQRRRLAGRAARRRRSPAGRRLIVPVHFHGARRGFVIDAMSRRQQVGNHAVVAGGDQRPRAHVLLAAILKIELSHHFHGGLPVGIAVRIELAEIGAIGSCGAGRFGRRGQRHPARLVRDVGNLERRLAARGRGGPRLVFQNDGLRRHRGAPEMPIVIRPASAVRPHELRAVVQPDLSIAHGKTAELHAHAHGAGGTEGGAPERRAIGRGLPRAALHPTGRRLAVNPGPQPGTRRGKPGLLGFAQRRKGQFPRPGQAEPKPRRRRLDARGTLRPGVVDGLFPGGGLRTGNPPTQAQG